MKKKRYMFLGALLVLVITGSIIYGITLYPGSNPHEIEMAVIRGEKELWKDICVSGEVGTYDYKQKFQAESGKTQVEKPEKQDWQEKAMIDMAVSVPYKDSFIYKEKAFHDADGREGVMREGTASKMKVYPYFYYSREMAMVIEPGFYYDGEKAGTGKLSLTVYSDDGEYFSERRSTRQNPFDMLNTRIDNFVTKEDSKIYAILPTSPYDIGYSDLVFMDTEENNTINLQKAIDLLNYNGEIPEFMDVEDRGYRVLDSINLEDGKVTVQGMKKWKDCLYVVLWKKQEESYQISLRIYKENGEFLEERELGTIPVSAADFSTDYLGRWFTIHEEKLCMYWAAGEEKSFVQMYDLKTGEGKLFEIKEKPNGRVWDVMVHQGRVYFCMDELTSYTDPHSGAIFEMPHLFVFENGTILGEAILESNLHQDCQRYKEKAYSEIRRFNRLRFK